MQAQDPVCGMTINTDKAVAKKEYEGNTYLFCSAQCLNQFELAPERYAEESERPEKEWAQIDKATGAEAPASRGTGAASRGWRGVS